MAYTPIGNAYAQVIRSTSGPVGTVQIGTVTTGAPGSAASVTNSGNSFGAILNFTIPAGQQGVGGTASVGGVTTLPPGSQATVANNGTPQNAVLVFGIPAGLEGTAYQLASSDGSLVGYNQGSSGAVLRTLQSRLQQSVSVLDFGADPTGVTDSSPAFSAAVEAIAGAPWSTVLNYPAPDAITIIVPEGNFLLNSEVPNLGKDVLYVLHENATISDLNMLGGGTVSRKSIHYNTCGIGDYGAAFAVHANPETLDSPAGVMGFSDYQQIGTYLTRDSVGFFASNRSPQSLLTIQNATFSSTGATFAQLSVTEQNGIKVGSLVNTSGTSSYTGMITGFSGTSITVENWYEVGAASGTVGVPTSGDNVYVNPVTDVFGQNTAVTLDAGYPLPQTANGFELDIYNNQGVTGQNGGNSKLNAYGFTSYAYGQYDSDYAYFAGNNPGVTKWTVGFASNQNLYGFQSQQDTNGFFAQGNTGTGYISKGNAVDVSCQDNNGNVYYQLSYSSGVLVNVGYQSSAANVVYNYYTNGNTSPGTVITLTGGTSDSGKGSYNLNTGTATFATYLSVTNQSVYNIFGATVGWNLTGSNGECDIFLGPGNGAGIGGLNVYQLDNSGALVNPHPILAASPSGNLVTQNFIFSNKYLNGAGAAGDVTITAVQILGGYFTSNQTQTSNFTLTTDTALNIGKLIPQAQIGSSFVLRIFNNDQSSTGYSMSIAAGSGVDIVSALPNPPVPKGGYGEYLFTFTQVGTSPQISLLCVGVNATGLG